ncbi:MAG: KTSC domain-containing protein [Patescibacteria group bacterium]|nr:KTSC domain-containing protein [Patescibacteria group bacterium]
MEWISVKSSNLAAVAYDKDEKELHVRFLSGAVGYYRNVPRAKWLGLQAANSKGGFVNQHVKPQHVWVAGEKTASKASQTDQPGPILLHLQRVQKMVGKNDQRNLLYLLWLDMGKPNKGPEREKYEAVRAFVLGVVGGVVGSHVPVTKIEEVIRRAKEKNV